VQKADEPQEINSHLLLDGFFFAACSSCLPPPVTTIGCALIDPTPPPFFTLYQAHEIMPADYFRLGPFSLAGPFPFVAGMLISLGFLIFFFGLHIDQFTSSMRRPR